MNLDFSHLKILLIGDVMLDHYIYGTASRLSPEAPVPVLKVESEDYRLGGAGTVLRNLSSLGAHVSFISVIGNDIAGNKVTHLVGEVANCTPLLIQERDRPTTVKTRHISGHHQIARVDKEATNPILQRTYLQILSAINVDEYDAIILSDYSKGVVEQISQSIIAMSPDIPVIIDPKSPLFILYSKAFLVTPNLYELEKALNCTSLNTTDRINDACKQLQSSYGIKNILVTLGAAGMFLLRENGQSIKIPAEAKEVYDVTGAGDTVVAVMAACVASGKSLIESMYIANKAASVVVGKMGSVAIELEELCV